LAGCVSHRDDGHAEIAPLAANFRSVTIAHREGPKYTKIVDEFPLTVAGKVQKFKIREMMTRELGLTADAGIETA
jgi:fatty-acyl-CoA synthase